MKYQNDFLDEVIKIDGVLFEQNIDLQNFSTFKTKTIGDLARVKTIDAAQSLLKLCAKSKTQYIPLGWGANQVLKTFDGFYLKLDFEFNREEIGTFKERYELPASVSLAVLTSMASKLKLKGWEVFTGVPASLGGAIYMNAGTSLGEIGSIIVSFKYIDIEGNLIEHVVNEKTFTYRKNNILKPGELIVSAVLKTTIQSDEIPSQISNYLKLRNSTQPMNKNTCGCVFKNHELPNGSKISAGQILDLLGLKGFGINGIRISPIHANFFEHDGSLQDRQVISFLESVKYIVQLYTGIELEFEVQI